MGAVDRVAFNVPRSVRDADVVVLAIPVDQIEEMMRLIAPDLKESAVVIDTAPVKEKVAEWAELILPEGRHYVGLVPVINPAYLGETEKGLAVAHRDLFHNGVMAVITPSGTDSAAIKLAADLVSLLGSSPLFTDAVEVDSLMAATHLLPQILAAALVDTTADQPGWREGRKLAGRVYALMTAPLDFMDTSEALGSASAINRANVTRMIDKLIATLQTIRTEIVEEDATALQKRLGQSEDRRARWIHERMTAEWTSVPANSGNIPSASQLLGRMLFGRRGKDD
jgi:prephenate dehydrogenase